jgi:hypothetical protein
LTIGEFGVNCGAPGVGERVGAGVKVTVGGSVGVKVLVGKLAIGVGPPDGAKKGALQAIINKVHASKRIRRCGLIVFPLANNLILFSVTWQV